MPQQLFLSHDSRDKDRAESIAIAISRITLGQISVWHSSDSSPTGGLKPGNVWLDEIRARLLNSRAVVALLTPTSLTRPWLLFESGFGASNPACDIIPVCVGIDRLSDVPFPLAMYQTYQLSDYDSLKRFLQKLLVKYEIPFDEEMARPVLLEAIKQLGQSQDRLESVAATSSAKTIDEAVSELKDHIDKRLISLISTKMPIDADSVDAEFYTLPIELNLKGKGRVDQFIEIGPTSSVQDILDNIYYMLDGRVEAYKYLEQWLLRNIESEKNLIVRNFQSKIPARYIFTPGSKWEVKWLKRPYSAGDDKEIIG